MENVGEKAELWFTQRGTLIDSCSACSLAPEEESTSRSHPNADGLQLDQQGDFGDLTMTHVTKIADPKEAQPEFCPRQLPPSGTYE